VTAVLGSPCMRNEADLGDDAACLGAMTGVGGSGTSAGTDFLALNIVDG
jgi:hypothetical protein